MSDKRIERVLRQHVETDQLLGVQAVPLGRVGASAGGSGADVGGSTVDGAASPLHPELVAEQGPEPAARASGAAFGAGTPVPSRPVGGASLFAPPPGPVKRLGREEKVRLLGEMDANEVRPCTKCALCRSRTQTVFGEGDPDAQLMFIGEGPGQTEDQTGRPFVGRAGELLDKMIAGMKFERKQVFIANIVKCRPPENRPPTPDETDACWDYLRRQILIIQPRVIVTLGAPATKTLLQVTTGIMALRGVWHQLTRLGPVIPVMPTFHPAYLLRNYSVDARGKVWSDLKQVMQLLETK